MPSQHKLAPLIFVQSDVFTACVFDQWQLQPCWSALTVLTSQDMYKDVGLSFDLGVLPNEFLSCICMCSTKGYGFMSRFGLK